MGQVAMTRRVHAVHLLNDFSGSPLVFQIALQDLIDIGHEINLYTACPSGQGFLSKLRVFENVPIFYKWSPNKWLTLLFFMWAQCSIFFKLLFRIKRQDTVYVNTLLPFGALWAARLRGCRCVVHVHEVSLKPALLKRWLVWSTEMCACDVIFVSNFVKSQYDFIGPQSHVVLNRLSKEFLARIPAEKLKYAHEPRTILMVGSLKAYKGIEEFVAIARLVPHRTFELVLNANSEAVQDWVSKSNVPANCTCFPSQSDTHSFYARAGIVMNLSRPNEWLETFGMTILEGLAYKAFVIVPTQGAPKELIVENETGISIDGKYIDQIAVLVDNYFRLSGIS